MDGVLADTGPIHFASWVKLGKRIGIEFTKEFFEQTFGQKSTTITRKLVVPEVDEENIEKWANFKEKIYREMVEGKLEPLPGVINLLTDLKLTGFKLAVGSSGPSENVDLLLNSLKIKEFFDVIITAAEVEKGKPDPDVFLIAADTINIKPENCIVIEDAPVGIEAAKRAGMKSIALTTTHNKEELVEAQLIIEDLSKITIDDILLLFDLI
jgi:beta-phosphoglucomutase family hydrolase